jgi:bifunctional UDP-N-acetylglucosamine pyrophosphorylase / glucosamine-1-phosphate N-acetyltransferase
VERVLLVPAAGTGSRLGGPLPKLLVRVDGRSMIAHLLDLYAPVVDRAVVVVSPAARAAVQNALEHRPLPAEIVVQDSPTGMLDAILLAREAVEVARPRRVLITWCDQIAVSPWTVSAVAEAARGVPEPPLVLPTCLGKDPYVHLDRDVSGRIVNVRHRREGDEMPASGESDAGVFDLSAASYLDWLPEYARAPAIGARTGERNFVPFVAWVAARGRVVTVPCSLPEEAIGINTPAELQRIEAYLRERRR